MKILSHLNHQLQEQKMTDDPLQSFNVIQLPTDVYTHLPKSIKDKELSYIIVPDKMLFFFFFQPESTTVFTLSI